MSLHEKKNRYPEEEMSLKPPVRQAVEEPKNAIDDEKLEPKKQVNAHQRRTGFVPRLLLASEDSEGEDDDDDDDSMDRPGAFPVRHAGFQQASSRNDDNANIQSNRSVNNNNNNNNAQEYNNQNLEEGLVVAELAEQPETFEGTPVREERMWTTNKAVVFVLVIMAILLVVVGAAVVVGVVLLSKNNENSTPTPTMEPTATSLITSNETTTSPTTNTMPPSFMHTPAPTSNPLLFRSAADTDLCLTIENENPAKFNRVHLDACRSDDDDGNVVQEFQIDSNGYFRFHHNTSWCIEGDTDLWEDGENWIFVYEPCIDQWIYRSDCTLFNVGHGEDKCLTSGRGIELTLELCGSSEFQKWYSSSVAQCTG